MQLFHDFLSAEKVMESASAPTTGQPIKCEAVLEWLEKTSKEKRVLLVYDDTGITMDKELRDYFPNHCPAHRIVIGSNTSTCSLANSFIKVELMSMDDAVDMFCGLAQIEQPLADDDLDVVQRMRKQKEITHLQGSEILTGPGSYNWVLAFEKIKQRKDSLTLLCLFTFLHGLNINSKLLERFHNKCFRWSTSGEQVALTAEDDGVDPGIATLLRDEERFEIALKPLLDGTFVRRKFNPGIPGCLWYTILSGLGRLSDATAALQSWKTDGQSPVEKRSKRLIDTALNNMLILLGELDQSMIGLEEIYMQARFDGPVKNLEEFNWVTTILGQLCCVKGEWGRVIEVISPMLNRYVRDGRVFDYITSDLRLVQCEALLLSESRYAELDDQIGLLERDLLVPE
ncbi:hypothetical protein B0T24DRAFT_664698 [Lasiosphaeria ovina]|uniref:NB-ARC domain-containing protein n=1 Tax=Lasiosphaeria ovina TaxID=92902 RepID=A0AAE0NAK1_9PEZI|nr:hypothetical protein B0T24DRAFT_664698 [Lasiosphaeria ovina]